ncbi:uncharacterized protein LOC115313362 [Ixodes scapularis]|uniref:uncharacterized protein LOC115313362 n=1 Tax=Ixodes scapularis TaxID=6945 RepID=UPI001C3821B0|nr:uncharacterized protein LOC115313362 [Ixodes scapularis]
MPKDQEKFRQQLVKRKNDTDLVFELETQKRRDVTEELKELRRTNALLQRALCSKVFELESRLLEQWPGSSTPLSHLTATSSAMLPESPENEHLETAHLTATSSAMLPESPENEHLEAGEDCSTSYEACGQGSKSPCNDAFVATASDQERNSNDYHGEQKTAVGQQREDGKVCAGQNVWIDMETWESLMEQETDSKFCRLAAVSLWPADVLAKRSVTGTLPNSVLFRGYHDPFPALTPAKLRAFKELFGHYLDKRGAKDKEKKGRLKKLRVHLSRKISDLRRPKSQRNIFPPADAKQSTE